MTDGLDTVVDFWSIGIGSHPNETIRQEPDVIQFKREEFTARNLLIIQQGTDLLIQFESIESTQALLQNVELLAGYLTVDQVEVVQGTGANINHTWIVQLSMGDRLATLLNLSAESVVFAA